MTVAVSAKTKVNGEDVNATVKYDFGSDVTEMLNLFGDDVVFNAAGANLRTQVQNVIRRGLVAGISEEQIVTIVANWKPGMDLRIEKDPVFAMKEKLAGMDPTAAAQLLANLKASLQG